MIRELLDAGLLHEDVQTVMGPGLRHYATEPLQQDGELVWKDAVAESANLDVVRPVSDPFAADGGLKVLDGNIGRSVIKVSAVKPEHRQVSAPALVFESQDDFMDRFKAGELERDFIAVLRFQGPRANGMPELHRLTPALGSLQDRGFKVALVTDGRMSGASGKVPAAIHVSPEAALGGLIGKVQDGDPVVLDAAAGTLRVEVDGLADRPSALAPASAQIGMGRELFTGFRQLAGPAEEGGLSIPGLDQVSLTALETLPA